MDETSNLQLLPTKGRQAADEIKHKRVETFRYTLLVRFVQKANNTKGARKDMFTDLLTPPSGSDPKTYLATRGG